MTITSDTSLAIMQAAQPQDKAATAKLMSAAKSKEEMRLDIAAQDFEAMFVAQMLKPMFEGLEVDGMFGGGKGEEVFRGFLIQEYGKIIAERGELGIADALKAQLIEMQGQA